MSDKEIESLEEQLRLLQLEFNVRANEITNKLQRIRRRQSIERNAEEANTTSEEVFVDAQEEHRTDTNNIKIKKGDWVKVTNDYRYFEKGKGGEVFKFNKCGDRLWLRTNSREIIQRAPWNVEKTTEPVD